MIEEPDLKSKRRIRAHDLIWVVIAIVVGLGVWAIFIWRTSVSTHKQNHLCGVIAAIVYAQAQNAGSVNDPAYHYYQEHPDSLALARLGDQAIIQELGCQPISLSPTKG